MSRIAIHCRPILPRTRFFASSANTVTKKRQSRYFSIGLLAKKPKKFSSGATTEPDAGVVGEPLHADEHPVEEELRGKRRDREIEPLDAQARHAEQDADERRHQPAEQDAPEHRQRRNVDGENLQRNHDAGAELVGAVGADRHERAAAERELAAIAGEDVQADRGERQDQERNEDGAQQIFAAQRPDLERVEHRDADEREDQQGPERDAILANREDRHVG